LCARARHLHGFRPRADADFQAAVDLSPNAPEVWAIRGRIFAELGLWDRLVNDFAQAEKVAKTAEDWLTIAREAARSASAAEKANDAMRQDTICRIGLGAVKKSIDAGLADRAPLTKDAAFDPLRKLPEFKEIVK
jgi:gamma-glutamylcysteine synthetase